MLADDWIPDRSELDMLRSAMASAVALPPMSSVAGQELEDFIAGITELTAHRGRSRSVVRHTKRDVARRIVEAFNAAGMTVVKQCDPI